MERRRRSLLGLTVAEVIIGGVVALLLLAVASAVLLPIFTPSHHHAPRAASISNLKQHALALEMYRYDYDGLTVKADEWVDLTMPYTKNAFIYDDPMLGQKGSYGYAFFEPLSQMDIDTLASPAEIPIAFQSALHKRNATSDLSTLPSPPMDKRGNIVAFVDCHAKPQPADWPPGPIVIEFMKVSDGK